MAEDNVQEQPQKSSKTMLIVILVVVVNLIIVGVVVGVFVLGKNNDAQQQAPAAAVVAGPTSGPGNLLPMENFVVNVRSQEGGKYLKTSIVVEMKGDGAPDVFTKWEKLLRNEVLVYLSGLEVEDTQTGKQKRAIEEKIKNILNARIGAEMVSGVYFTEFVTQ